MSGTRDHPGPMDYVDFELEIGLGSDLRYPVTVLSSPAGEAEDTMTWPFDSLALESYLDKLEIALLQSGGIRRRVPSAQQQAVEDFGRILFDTLFTGDIRSLYDVSRRMSIKEGQGLRLKLRIEAPELAALPWEFLYDSRLGEFVCLSRHTPIVRYIEVAQPVYPLTVSPPLRILGMLASPSDLMALDVEREQLRLERAIAGLQSLGLVSLTWLEGQTWRDLQQAMRAGPWHIFHFIGHGRYDRNSDEGLVYLADESGLTRTLSATQLGRLLADHQSLRLVLLNACEGGRASERDIFSSAATILVRRGIPAVVAMQRELTDDAAIEFTRAFYEALSDGLAVDAAVAEARKAMSFAVNNTVEWGVPVLYMRASSGRVFDVSTPTRPGVTPGEQDRAEEGVPDQRAMPRSEMLPELYTAAMLSYDTQDWMEAIGRLEHVVALDPGYQDAATKLAEARNQVKLADLYVEARRLKQAGRWHLVVDVFDQMKALEPGYPDPEGLLATALREIGVQEPKPGHPPAQAKPEPKKRPRWFWPVVAAGVLLLAVAIGLLVRSGALFGGDKTPLPEATMSVAVPTTSGEDSTTVPETPLPKPTDTLTPAPTDTWTPAPTDTLAPTETPTFTPEAATPTRAPTRRPTATPPSQVAYPVPVLLEPEEGANLSHPFTLSWRWTGQLMTDEWFDVRVWRENDPHYGIAWTKQTEYLFDPKPFGGGKFYWAIAVIRGKDGKWLASRSPESHARWFTYGAPYGSAILLPPALAQESPTMGADYLRSVFSVGAACALLFMLGLLWMPRPVQRLRRLFGPFIARLMPALLLSSRIRLRQAEHRRR